MKNMRKLFAMVLAIVMVLSLATTAFAYTIETTNDHTYEVYQIFTGDLSGKVLSNIVWGQNGIGLKGEVVPEDVLTELEAATGDDAAQLEVITEYANLDGTAFGTVTKDAPLTDVPAGYYLIKDRDGTVTGDDAYTLYIVKIVGDVTISPKGDTPEVEKKVDDKNDSNTTEDGESWKDSADYDVGDNVPFQITATLPSNYTDYETYTLTFVDTMSAGLTYNEDAQVYFGDANISENFEITYSTNDNGETVLTITCDNLKEIEGLTNSSEIVVKYTAELNDKADMGNDGNPNKVKIKYSNDPNWDGEGEDEPTGETPEDTVIVFTYQTIINKVDQDKQPLAGAEFTLEKFVASEDGTETYKDVKGNWEVVKVITSTDETSFTFAGLDDGEYRLSETKTPAGYNTIDPIYFTITATHTEGEEPKLTELNGEPAEGSEISFTVDLTEGSLTAPIQNNSGATLPETGGMGTHLFYLFGGVMVLAAVVLLVTKKRMASAE